MVFFTYEQKNKTGSTIQIPFAYISDTDVLTYNDMSSNKMSYTLIKNIGCDMTLDFLVDSKNSAGVDIPVLSLISGGSSAHIIPYNSFYASFANTDLSILYQDKSELSKEEITRRTQLLDNIDNTSTILKDYLINNNLVNRDDFPFKDTLQVIESCIDIHKVISGEEICNYNTDCFNISNQIKTVLSNYSNFNKPKYLIDNVNKYMSKATDELSLELPTVENVLETNIVKLPNKFSIMDPYDIKNVKENKIMSTSNYGRVQVFKDKDGNRLPIETIKGYASRNNDESEFSNESAFLDRLCSFINELVLAYEDMNTSTPLEKDEFISNLVEHPVNDNGEMSMPNQVFTILEDMALTLTSWNWRHCSSLPTGIDPSSLEVESDSDSDSDKESDKGSKLKYQGTTGKFSTRAQLSLHQRLDKATKTDFYAIAKYIIRVLRWGERKPSKVKFPTLDSFIDYNNDGSLSAHTETIDLLDIMNSGNKLTVVNSITSNFTVADPNLLSDVKEKVNDLGLDSFDISRNINIPVGFLCNYSKGNSDIFIAVSYNDIYSSYKEGIEFLDKVTGTIDSSGNLKMDFSNASLENVMSDGSMDIRQVISMYSKDSEVIKFYQSNDLINLLENTSVPLDAVNYFSLTLNLFDDNKSMFNIDRFSVDTLEEFTDELAGSNGSVTPREIVSWKVFSQIYDSVVYMGSKSYLVEDADYTMFINEYFEYLNKINFKYGFESSESNGDLASNVLASKLNNMSVYSDNKEVKEGDFKVNRADIIIDSLDPTIGYDFKKAYIGELVYNSEKASYEAVSKAGNIKPKAKRNVIGYVALYKENGVLKIVFIGDASKVPMPAEEVKGVVNALTIMKIQTQDMVQILSNNSKDVRIKFLGEDSYKAFNDMIDGYKIVI